MNLISIVLPAYNEEQTIGQEIDGLERVLKDNRINYEFIVVDDGSIDATARIVKEKKVRLVQHRTNRGVGAARKTGILEAKGEIIVTTDADGTYPQQDIPAMIGLINEYDMVVGARVGKNVDISFIRWLAKYLIRKLACYLCNSQIPDLNSGLRVFKKAVAVKYFYLLPNGHSWESTITLAFLCNGHAVKYLPIEYYKRKGGKSSFHPVYDTYNYISLVIRTIMYFNPLRIFMPTSFILFIMGLTKLIYDFINFNNKVGVFSVMIIIIAVLIAFLGLLADLMVVLSRKNNGQ